MKAVLVCYRNKSNIIEDFKVQQFLQWFKLKNKCKNTEMNNKLLFFHRGYSFLQYEFTHVFKSIF